MLYLSLLGAYTLIHSSTLLHGLNGVSLCPSLLLPDPLLTPETFNPPNPLAIESEEELLLID